MGRRPWLASGALRAPPLALALALALTLALATPALAASTLEVVPKQPLEGPLRIAPAGRVEVTWDVVNHGDTNATVTVHVLAPPGWNATVLPAGFVVPGRAEGAVRSFTLGVVAPDRPRPDPVQVTVVLGAVAGDATETQELVVRFQVQGNALVLGLFGNPLPPPLDNAYGVFLLELGFWALVAAGFIGIQDPLVRFLTRRGEKRTSARIAALVRVPVFVLIVVLGVRSAWASLPSGPVTDLGERLLYAVVVVLAMVVAYRVLRAVLMYYAVNIAAKTETQLDDVLVPVLEKVGGVLIVIVGVLTLVAAVGVDLGAFVVGGTLASLVIAFAAQDTLSNFFSGLFILADRPFVVGDEIILVDAGFADNVFRVERIGLRTTRLYDPRNHQMVTVPNNSLATKPVINVNSPDKRYRVEVRVSVGYDADQAVVQRILLQAAKQHPETLDSPIPIVARLARFGESSLDWDVLFFVRDAGQRFAVAGDVRLALFEALRQSGIAIPYPTRVVHLARDGTAAPPPAPAAPAAPSTPPPPAPGPGPGPRGT